MLAHKHNILLEQSQNHHTTPYHEIASNKSFLQLPLLSCEVVYYNKFVLQRLVSGSVVNQLPDKEFSYSSRSIREGFNHLKSTRFDFFFRHNGVDIPKCFQRSHSLRRQQHGLLFLRLVNFFMRHGLRLRTIKLFTETLANLTLDVTRSMTSLSSNLHSWQQLFSTLATVGYNGGSKYQQVVKDMGWSNEQAKKYSWDLDDQSYVTPLARRYKGAQSNYSLLFENIRDMEPMYNFYVYRVAKKIYKNTRGKSGRYTFIWKYIAPYKRTYVTYYWLFKELQLKTDKQVTKRVIRIITALLFKPTNLWASRVSRFSTLYVYRHCRVTLAETYRSVTK